MSQIRRSTDFASSVPRTVEKKANATTTGSVTLRLRDRTVDYSGAASVGAQRKASVYASRSEHSTRFQEKKARLKSHDREHTVEGQIEGTKGMVQQLRLEALNKDREIVELQHRLASCEEQATRHIHGLEASHRHLESHLNEVQLQLQQSESRHSKMSDLLDVRTAELKGAQTFLTKADQFSGGDVVRLAESLNSEIFQLCASLAEMVFSGDESSDPEGDKGTEEERKAFGMKAHRVEEYATQLEGLLGPDLTSLLCSDSNAQCGQILTAYDTTNPKIDSRLQYIHQQLSLREDAAVAGRWRALAMAQLRRYQPIDIESLTRTLKRAIIVACFHCPGLLLSTWASVDDLSSAIRSRLDPIKAALSQLKHAIGEGVTSCKIEPVVPSHGHPSSSAYMENPYALEKDGMKEKFNGAPIVGTINLGLQKVTTTRKSDGSFASHAELLLKPHVATLETFRDL
ncbi:hypothetical protein FA15DRAFT_707735 [Coprinopsis marcescibilis]|uniref:Uncharacterized protein n=1 Tax=Coprinopsis marcescibilis TaxID=230819 RepID=A0A5C3KL15_COPMA|nr:hypothetical protein FA15DRAFT_707735 [Coprinopsis marcescibilis]